MYAIKIHMRQGCNNSYNLSEIDSILLDQGFGWVKKEYLHDYLKAHSGSVRVGINPCPIVIPATSVYSEKYVKSVPNSYGFDNLLALPRE